MKILGEVRDRYQFALVGFVVMPDHFHLLMSEAVEGTPSTVLQVLKQRVSRELRQRQKSAPAGQVRFYVDRSGRALPQFWERRFYDFNVWSHRKKSEKLQYMHDNPVKRGLVTDPKDWPWSSYAFYSGRGERRTRVDPVG